MEQVTAWKSNDGKLWNTPADATRHDNLKQATEELVDLLRSHSLLAHGQIDADLFVEEVIGADFGRELFKILSLVHSK